MNESYLKDRIATAKPEFVWQDGRTQDWIQQFRDAFRKCLGIEGWEKTALCPVSGPKIQLTGHTRTQFEFQSRPGLQGFGYLLEPDDSEAAGPAILCLPGHGSGVDNIVGILPLDYQADFALQCVSRGYRVFAMEQFSFGHRRTDPSKGYTCMTDSPVALMLGESMAGWRVWDAIRVLDLMETLPGVDVDNLAVMGISGGGLTALFTGCLDARVKATVVSGYFNTFKDSILSIDHCIDNYVPGLLNLTEMPDLASLIRPRYLFVESGKEDPIFPLEAFRYAVNLATQIYSDCPQNFDFEEFEGDHHFHGVSAFRFLEEHLPIRKNMA